MSGVVLPFFVDADRFSLVDDDVASSPATCALQINPTASLEALRAAAERRVRALGAFAELFSLKSTDPQMAECALALSSMASEAMQLLEAMGPMAQQAMKVGEQRKGGAA